MLRNKFLKVPVTAQHVATVRTMVGNIKNALGGVFLNLTAKDKARCLKVGVSQLGMISQIRRICVQHPDLMPRYHDLAEYYTIVDSIENLLAIRGEVTSLMESIDGTLTGVKDDGLRMSLDFYQAFKRGTESALPGLRKQFMEIRDNFMNQTGQSPDDLLGDDSDADDESDDPKPKTPKNDAPKPDDTEPDA